MSIRALKEINRVIRGHDDREEINIDLNKIYKYLSINLLSGEHFRNQISRFIMQLLGKFRIIIFDFSISFCFRFVAHLLKMTK